MNKIKLIFFFLPSAIGQYNLDFEKVDSAKQLPIGWELLSDNTCVKNRIDSINNYHGKYSFLIDFGKKKNKSSTLVYSYNIKSEFIGLSVMMTGFAKTKNFKCEDIYYKIYLMGENGELVDEREGKPSISGTDDWKEYGMILSHYTIDVDNIRIAIVIKGGEGKIWFDNFNLYVGNKNIKYMTPNKLHKRVLKDTAFNTSSGVKNIHICKNTIKNLTDLCILWGIVKYYHPSVREGNYNMDAELFRILPKVLENDSLEIVNNILENWIDQFGLIDTCNINICDKNIRDCGETDIKPDFDYIFNNKNFICTTIPAKIQCILNHCPDNGNYYIRVGDAGNAIFQNELKYNNLSYPDVGFRLLALFRYWNAVQYFFPYKNLIKKDWIDVLADFIPQFINADGAKTDVLAKNKNAQDIQKSYLFVCMKLFASIQDTHAMTDNSSLEYVKGYFTSPFISEFIEGKLMVTGFCEISGSSHIYNYANNIKIGDIIEAIDSIPIQELINKYWPYVPASNYAVKLRNLSNNHDGFLFRSNNNKMILKLLRGKDTFYTIVNRVHVDSLKDPYEMKKNPGYLLISDSIGYIYPANLQDDDFYNIKKKFNGTKGIVFDLRCYPSTNMVYAYSNWIKNKSSVFAKIFSCDKKFPGFFTMDSISSGENNPNNYKGKIVVLVNSQTQSAAEYLVMALSSAEHVTVVGDTTAGADGNVSFVTLPWGIKTAFSGLGIYYPDGTGTQQVGIKIDINCKPTIEGIKNIKDELLEKAIDVINNY